MDFPKLTVAFAFPVVALLISVSDVRAQSEPGWSLVWSDEFNGPNIDMSKWTFQTGPSDVNSELEYYSNSTQNAFIQDSALVIRALNQSEGGRNYTSAKLYTQNKGDWLYGRFEVRAKLNNGQGMWPAIWMMPTDNAYGGWPASGEIDIMELLGNQPNKEYSTIHWAGSGGANTQQQGTYTLRTGDFSQNFHVFAFEWDVNQERFYLDDSLYFTATHGQPFDKRFYLILNVAVGGSWPGNPDNTTPFPNDMVVDYVRVYTKSTTAIDPVPAAQGFEISANPFPDQTLITNGPAESEVALRDISGRILEQRRLSAGESRAFGKNLSNGIYFLQVISQGQMHTAKLIKTR